MADLEMDQEYEEMEFVAVDERRYIVLVIYDIVDNKRRSRMVKCVERYGVRVQKSAFEAFLSKKKYERLVEETSRLIDLDTDSLRIYLLADHTSVRSWGVGRGRYHLLRGAKAAGGVGDFLDEGRKSCHGNRIFK